MSLQQILVATGGAAPITPISLVASVSAQSDVGHGTVTTSGIDTTGATLLVVSTNSLLPAVPTISDSKGNIWVSLTEHDSGGSFSGACVIFYCKNPVVGAGHTFTANGASIYADIFVLAFTNTDTTRNADGDSGAGLASNTSIQPGAITPSANNSVVVTSFLAGSAGTISIDSGFTIPQKIESGGNFYGGIAYKVQTTAQAENPTWSTTAVADRLATGITSFFLS